ncbi:hypothetical protein [Paraburkholderia sp. RAU2J]|uniref:hypothetical protein n=1 Tax=Paraburkholderia sp. RAU2J TaxID=1938810 RepID=UPI000EAFAB82|nr:hypothetical protein [Paraburkholderia sp. RAU2J]
MAGIPTARRVSAKKDAVLTFVPLHDHDFRVEWSKYRNDAVATPQDANFSSPFDLEMIIRVRVDKSLMTMCR